MELSEIIIDPEFKKLIPPLTPEERKDLEGSLIADGCISPLVVWHGHDILLDGHNRHELCLKHDIECEVHEIVLESRQAAKAWIIKNQLGRRNLNESQRAMLAATLKEVFTAEAKERQAAGKGLDGSGGRGHAKNLQSNLTEGLSGNARDQAAAAMNVSSGLVHAAEKVKSHGSEKLQQAVMSGEVSVSAAAEVATLPLKEQDKAAAAGKRGVAAAAKKIRQTRRGEQVQSAPPSSRRKCKLTEKQFAQLAELVTELKRLTDVPKMQYSPIDVRACVAEIVKIVL